MKKYVLDLFRNLVFFRSPRVLRAEREVYRGVFLKIWTYGSIHFASQNTHHERLKKFNLCGFGRNLLFIRSVAVLLVVVGQLGAMDKDSRAWQQRQRFEGDDGMLQLYAQQSIVVRKVAAENRTGLEKRMGRVSDSIPNAIWRAHVAPFIGLPQLLPIAAPIAGREQRPVQVPNNNAAHAPQEQQRYRYEIADNKHELFVYNQENNVVHSFTFEHELKVPLYYDRTQPFAVWVDAQSHAWLYHAKIEHPVELKDIDLIREIRSISVSEDLAKVLIVSYKQERVWGAAEPRLQRDATIDLWYDGKKYEIGGCVLDAYWRERWGIPKAYFAPDDSIILEAAGDLLVYNKQGQEKIFKNCGVDPYMKRKGNRLLLYNHSCTHLYDWHTCKHLKTFDTAGIGYGFIDDGRYIVLQENRDTTVSLYSASTGQKYVTLKDSHPAQSVSLERSKDASQVSSTRTVWPGFNEVTEWDVSFLKNLEHPTKQQMALLALLQLAEDAHTKKKLKVLAFRLASLEKLKEPVSRQETRAVLNSLHPILRSRVIERYKIIDADKDMPNSPGCWQQRVQMGTNELLKRGSQVLQAVSGVCRKKQKND